MSSYTFTDLTEFSEIPDKNPVFVIFGNCNFQRLNLESYKIGMCYFINCQIIEPLTINCYCLSIENSNIKLSEHVKIDTLIVKCPEFVFEYKIKVKRFSISNSTIKGIHNIKYSYFIVKIGDNESLLNMIIKEDLLKDKNIHYELIVTPKHVDVLYDFIYHPSNYNITGYCGLDSFDVLRNKYRKIKFIKAVEALQKKIEK